MTENLDLLHLHLCRSILQDTVTSTGRLVGLAVEIADNHHVDTAKIAGSFAAQGVHAARLLGLYAEEDPDGV